jgi:hypothetical protein
MEYLYLVFGFNPFATALWKSLPFEAVPEIPFSVAIILPLSSKMPTKASAFSFEYQAKFSSEVFEPGVSDMFSN